MSKPPKCALGLTHRGHHHNRTLVTEHWRSIQRERAFAKHWERENVEDDLFAKIQSDGSGGTNAHSLKLLGEVNQQTAAGAAGAIQWLGSDVGFEFLKAALADAGYDIVDSKQKS
jgi:hypothetical protein